MNRAEQETILRRLLVCAPQYDLHHAQRAVEALAEGNLVPLTYDYSVPRREALQMLRAVWASERQDAAAYEAVRLYLARIGVPL